MKTMARYCISTLKTNMAKENVRIGFSLKEIDETRHYLLEIIKQ